MRAEHSYGPTSLGSLLPNLRAAIALDSVASFNRIVAASPTATLGLNGKQVAFALVNNWNAKALRPFSLRLSVGDKQLTLRFDIALLCAIYAGQVTLVQAKLNLVELMVRHALGAHIDALAKRLGKSATLLVEPAVQDADIALAIEATVQDDPAPHSILVSGDFDLAEAFLDLCTTDAQSTNRLGAVLDTEISTAATLMQQSDAQQLAVGDLMFVPKTSRDDLFFLKVGGVALTAIQHRNGHLIIGQNMDHKTLERDAVAGKTKTPLILENPQLGKSQVNLTVELGRWKLTLDEVQKLSEGMLFELGNVDTDNATLRINGDAVATGSLVNVGDGVGLRIKTVI